MLSWFYSHPDTFNSILPTLYLLPIARYLIFVTWNLLPDICLLIVILQYLLFDKCYLRLVTKYLLPDTCYLLLVTWCWLPDTFYLTLFTWTLFNPNHHIIEGGILLLCGKIAISLVPGLLVSSWRSFRFQEHLFPNREI